MRAEATGLRPRAVLYEETPDPNGKKSFGPAVWQTAAETGATESDVQLAVSAKVAFPERGISAKLIFRHATDLASDAVEISFTLTPHFVHGGIKAIPGVLMKEAEATQGIPLTGRAVKVKESVFLIVLSSVNADLRRNNQLLRERSWINVPIVYDDGVRAVLAVQKGRSGERAFADAFDTRAIALPRFSKPSSLVQEIVKQPMLPRFDLRTPTNLNLGRETRRTLIPLQFEGGTFTVPVSINNQLTLDFVLDSGAADVAIPADIVSSLLRTGTLSGADFLGEQTYRMADGSTARSQTFRIKFLKVGDKVVENVTASTASVGGGLLLGQSFLSRLRSWSIDNQRQLLVLQ